MPAIQDRAYRKGVRGVGVVGCGRNSKNPVIGTLDVMYALDAEDTLGGSEGLHVIALSDTG